MIEPKLVDQPFSRTRPDLTTLNLMAGHAEFSGVLAEDFISEFQIGEFSSAPFHGLSAKGRLFIIGNIRCSDDHLTYHAESSLTVLEQSLIAKSSWRRPPCGRQRMNGL